MKKLFLSLTILLLLVSVGCSNEIESNEIQKEVTMNREIAYKEAWYHADGDIVMPIQLQNPSETMFLKYDVLDNRSVQDVSGYGLYKDPVCTIPIGSNDWTYCGNGVYTNGSGSTYTVTYYEGVNGVLAAPWPCTIVWDEFAQHWYAYTTAWGGVCTF